MTPAESLPPAAAASELPHTPDGTPLSSGSSDASIRPVAADQVPTGQEEAHAAGGHLLPRWVRVRRRMVTWLARWMPAPVNIDGKELLRVACGMGIGALLLMLLGVFLLQPATGGPWMLASFGASLLLVMALPSSPLSQPWPVLGGSALAVLMGNAAAALMPVSPWAVMVSVVLTLVLMVPLRCLHPPGAALAVQVVLIDGIASPEAAWYVLGNALVVIGWAALYNTLTGRNYPARRQHAASPRGKASVAQFTASDLDAALGAFNQVLDISRADLEELLHHAGHAAFQRTLGDLRCEAIMSHPPFAVEPDVSLSQAWDLMRRENIKALPVIDPEHRVVGIITQSDFMRQMDLNWNEGVGSRLKHLFLGKRGRPSSVRDLMVSPVVQAHVQAPAMELLPLFSKGRRFHIPIVEGRGRLVGMVTQTDLLHALSAAIPGVAPSTPDASVPGKG